MPNFATIEQSHWLNPVVLKWAREWRGRSIEDAANHLRKNTEVIEAWEDGDNTPTVKQARKLAKYYGRPFLEFLLPRIPALPPDKHIPDYRLHREADISDESWEVTELRNWIATRREYALELYQELGESVPEFPRELTANIDDSPDRFADLARNLFQFNIDTQLNLTSKQKDKLPGIIRSIFHEFGVLVLKRSEMSSMGIRGICLAEVPLPTIVFTNESPTAQAFTLVHELGHVILRESGISGSVNMQNRVEKWCNKFAAAFLIPASKLTEIAGNPPNQPEESIDDHRLKSLARTFRVSPHVMLIRLTNLGYVCRDFYWEFKRSEFIKEEAEFKGGGISEYYGSRYRSSLGDLYTGLVLDAWGSGQITNHNAAEYMGIKNLRHLFDIRDRFGDA